MDDPIDPYISQLRLIPAYKVIVPVRTYTRDHRPLPVVVETAYPIDHLTYDFDEAEVILTIFTRRWIDNGSLPDEELMPRARSVSSGVSFTLADIRPGLFSRRGSGTGEDEE